jgi:hypothetical protein
LFFQVYIVDPDEVCFDEQHLHLVPALGASGAGGWSCCLLGEETEVSNYHINIIYLSRVVSGTK